MEEREPYLVNMGARSVLETPPANAHSDKLTWQDKVPLALALVAQSYVVFIWYLHSTHGIHPYVDFVVALAAGIALDWLTVSTVMGRREGRTSIWSWLTSVGAFVGSAMIAYDTYALWWWPLDGKALLHICYPLVVLLYSLHLASPKQPKNEQARQAVPAVSADEWRIASTPGAFPRAVAETDRTLFTCPACGNGLDSIGELGAAKRWGHCRKCKDTNPIPLSYSENHR